MAPAQECDAEVCEMSSLRMPEQVPDVNSEEWIFLRARQKHNIFLSHSGAQKDFVDQLCKDLEEAKLSPFFDRRPLCLPEGEEFAPRIFHAAQKCEVAVVVISDEYFFRTPWPMLELEKLVQAPGRKILPLFYKLKCEDFKKPKRQERWFEKWNEWARSDSRIDVDRWKNALRKLGGMKGMNFVPENGEVSYRKDIVSKICSLMQLGPQDAIIDLEACTSEGNQNLVLHPGADVGRFQRLLSNLVEWTMIICFPFCFAALLKLVMVKIVIILVVLYIVLIIIIVPVVRDTMQCLSESEHLNLETLIDRYHQHLA